MGFVEFKYKFYYRKSKDEFVFIIRHFSIGAEPLYYIRNNIGFGKVNKHVTKIKTNFFFIIYDIKNLYLISLLLNDNSVILPFYLNLDSLFLPLNKKFIKLLGVGNLVKEELKLIPLNNNWWLSGFLDSNCDFYIDQSFVNLIKYKLVFFIPKEKLVFFQKFLKISLSKNFVFDYFYDVKSLNLYLSSFDWSFLLEYLLEYKLKFLKKEQFNFWKNLLCSDLNYQNRFVKKGGVFNFHPFLTKYKRAYPNNALPSIEFLEWLIGFTEGDGSFILAKRGDLSFVITQSGYDLDILNFIKNNLLMGSIYIQSKKQNTYRFIIQNIKELSIIVLLFNGNLVLPTSRARFHIFVSKLNELFLRKNNEHFIIIDYTQLWPTLKDSWFLGFVDAEGCFSVNNFSVRFSICQKWNANKMILEHISYEFFKNTPHSDISFISHAIINNSNFWYFNVFGLDKCSYLFNYFDKFELKSKKRLSYFRWKVVYNYLKDKVHLNSEKDKKFIYSLIQNINKKD